MGSSTVAATREPVAQPAARRRARLLLRWGAPAAYLIALGLAISLRGLPTSRDALFLWILLGLAAASATDLRRRLPRLVSDWLPFGAILFGYDVLRGSADRFFAAHVEPQLRADEVLFGGTVPTVWLQERLWDGPERLDWIDYAAWSVYLTHFFATLLLAAVLWLVSSDLFRRYVAMVSVLALTGFVTYAFFPAAPPWLASADGRLEHTDRIARFVSQDAPVGFFGAIWERGERYANDVAAVPSLHAAYAMLIALFLWRVTRWRWRVPLVAYAVAMGLALVYTAEHYVSDILLGWVYAAAAFAAVELALRRRRTAGG